jgi:hypothetical protein
MRSIIYPLNCKFNDVPSGITTDQRELSEAKCRLAAINHLTSATFTQSGRQQKIKMQNPPPNITSRILWDFSALRPASGIFANN